MDPLMLVAATITDDGLDGMHAGLLLIRVVIGLTMAAHGYNKFFGGGKIKGTAGWFDSMGMKPNGRIHAILAASTELGSGLLFALGLLTPFAAAAMVSLMIVAAWTVHRKNGFFVVKDGIEYNFILATIAVGVAAIGPGKYALDDVFGLDFVFDSTVAVVIAVGLGVLAGVGLLACCYRPPVSDQD